MRKHIWLLPVLLALSGCIDTVHELFVSNPLSGGIAPGMGRIIIALDESQSRTLFPNAPRFVSYLLEFQYQGDGELSEDSQTTASLPCPVDLPPGPWLVTVTAYTRITGVQGLVNGNYPAARGSAQVTVSSGGAVPLVTVDLYNGTAIAGKGVLEYNIGLPIKGLLTGAMLQVLDMNKNEIASGDLLESASGGIALDAGYYLLQVQVTTGRPRSKTELIHIYSGHTTRAAGSGWNFNTEEGIFLSAQELAEFLADTPSNTVDDPYAVRLIVNLGSLSDGQDSLGHLFNALEGRYVYLNLGDSTGSIGNSSSQAADLSTGRDKLVSLILPDGLTGIGNYAFNNCTSLIKVTIPLGIGTVNASAFTNCGGLDSLAFIGTQTSLSVKLPVPDWVKTADLSACTALTSLGGNVFANCTALETVILPESLTTINGNAFQGCTSLKALPEMPGIINISNSAFEGCTGLYSDTGCLDLSEYAALRSLGDNTFRNCTQFTSFVFPSSLQTLGAVFSGCTGLVNGLTNADLSACTALKTITGTFNGFTALISVTLPEGLETIGGNSFSSCSALTTVNFPKSLKVIADSNYYGAFYRTALTSVDFSGCTVLTNIGESAFSYCTVLSSVDLSGCTSLKTINNYAFMRCSNLRAADFSGCTALTTIGDSVFLDTALITVDLSGFTSLTSIGNYAFNNKSLVLTNLSGCKALTSIGNNAFSSGSLTSADLSGCNALKYLNDNGYENAFSGTALTSLDLSDCPALETLGKLKDCPNLVSVDLSACTRIKTLGGFVNCTSLLTVNLSGYTSLTSAGSISGCTKLTSVDFSGCTALTSVDTFSGCTVLRTVNLSGCTVLKNISASAFSGCNALNLVNLSGCTSLETLNSKTGNVNNVFYNSSAQAVNLSGCSALKSIDAYGFSRNSRLSSINLSGCTALSSIGANAFYQNTTNSGLGTVNLSGCTSLVSIGDHAFEGCALETLDLSDCPLLSSIGALAFRSSTNMTTVNLSNCTVLKNIDVRAFDNCPKLTVVDLSNNVTPPKMEILTDNLNNIIVDYYPFPIGLANLVFYVPAGSVTAYKNASVWSNYASQIRARP